MPEDDADDAPPPPPPLTDFDGLRIGILPRLPRHLEGGGVGVRRALGDYERQGVPIVVFRRCSIFPPPPLLALRLLVGGWGG